MRAHVRTPKVPRTSGARRAHGDLAGRTPARQLGFVGRTSGARRAHVANGNQDSYSEHPDLRTPFGSPTGGGNLNFEGPHRWRNLNAIILI